MTSSALFFTKQFKFHCAKNYLNVIRNFSAVSSKFELPRRFRGNDKSVWVEYIDLGLKYKPLNLGQGYPDFFAPSHVTDALASATKSNDPLLNQYTRPFGHPRLVNILGKLYSKVLNRNIDPYNEILVTAGAYEAVYSALQGHTDIGDEWIVIEPFFDCYESLVKTAGGVPRFVALKPKKTTGIISSADWVFDKDEMSSLFNKKTKGIILNTPQNPLGKVFTRDELEFIADLAKKWDAMVISDEVYEWMVYEPAQHIRIASLPDMYDRTITIGSAGKTFNVTGWKIGWAYGPEKLLHNLKVVHQNCVYATATPTQEAVAIGFEAELKRFGQPDCYFVTLAQELVPKRDFMAQFLLDVGMSPTVPDGGFFMIANWKALEDKVPLEEETDVYRDYKFTKWMTKNVGLQGIPPSTFYSLEHKHLGEDNVRYCFIKQDENLQKAADILHKWNSQLQKKSASA
ncbi:kynurenine aminotransferase [Microplitis demolitor]|uniref:kynurenine aminotransferase n=1 Tax=Microplitis demolitor TaxID=69319 RepID=UPI0004CCB7D5|nr:kynurenine aminotransferase [Microplitis demolitor]